MGAVGNVGRGRNEIQKEKKKGFGVVSLEGRPDRTLRAFRS